MIKIWFNHWFSTAYNIINLLKENEDDFYIIGSNENFNSVVKCVCDEWYVEPKFDENSYVDFCVGFCKEHSIDLFLPRRGMVQISKEIHRFEEIGTKVMVDNYEKISLLNDKSKAYELFKKNNIGFVPDYRIVTNVEEFTDAYEMLIKSYKRVCFKLATDEGAKSFWIIDDTKKGYEGLINKSYSRISMKDVIDALKEKDEFDPIMVMPVLSGNEVSVDCLKTEDGVIMLPREKGITRAERIFYDEQILGICQDFYEKVGLEYPCNIQFRYLDGVPYFLEVNTRMSGGVQMGCLASGVNIPNIAINKLIGNNKKWEMNKKEMFVSHIEKPLIV